MSEKEEKKPTKLHDTMLKALKQWREKELDYDPFLRERMIIAFGVVMGGLPKDYVRDNLIITPDVVEAFNTNRDYQADIARGNMVAFEFEGLAFVSIYEGGAFTFHLLLKGKLYEIRTILDLAKIVEPKEEE